MSEGIMYQYNNAVKQFEIPHSAVNLSLYLYFMFVLFIKSQHSSQRLKWFLNLSLVWSHHAVFIYQCKWVLLRVYHKNFGNQNDGYCISKNINKYIIKKKFVSISANVLPSYIIELRVIQRIIRLIDCFHNHYKSNVIIKWEVGRLKTSGPPYCIKEIMNLILDTHSTYYTKQAFNLLNALR